VEGTGIVLGDESVVSLTGYFGPEVNGPKRPVVRF
jgi:hypothetical protein